MIHNTLTLAETIAHGVVWGDGGGSSRSMGWYPPSQDPEKPRRRYIFPLNVRSSPPVLLLPFPVCPILVSSLFVLSERDHHDLGRILFTPNSITAIMPDINAANNDFAGEKGAIEHLDTKNDNDMPKPAPSVDVHDEKDTAFATDINHVAQLGFAGAAELEKKVVRALDTWMMPQLWILYMFNYLNRTNIAQARLNSLNQDLNLGEGDYQVSHYRYSQVVSLTNDSPDCRCRSDCRLHAGPAALEHAHHSRVS
jgi:hypothetical protein